MSLKKILFCAICLLGAPAFTFSSVPIMERMERLDASRHFDLVQNGKPGFDIVLPKESRSQTGAAAEELADLLRQACAAEIRISTEKSPGKTAIMLGELALQEEFGRNCSAFDRDGFVILSKPGVIVIAGRDEPEGASDREQGTLFGVYEFLERFAGFRFYFPGKLGTIVPRLENWRLPHMQIQERPDFMVRNIYWWAGVDGQKPGWYDQDLPMKENMRLQWRRLKLESRYLPCCHGLAYLDVETRFAESHPEYFALTDNGQRRNQGGPGHLGSHLCFSSAVKDEIYKDALALFSGKPASARGIKAWRSGQKRPFFDLWPNDGLFMCKCENCRQYTDSKAISEFMWGFACDIAERLKQNQVPGYVTFPSYNPFGEIPTRDIPDNVLVVKALGGPYVYHQDKLHKRDKQKIVDWHNKLGRKIWIWNYAHKLHGPAGIPNMIPNTIAAYYKDVKDYIFGALMESESDVWLSNYLGFYVFGKLAWNNSLDATAMLDEHFELMFKDAAPQMRQVFQIFEEKWLRIAGKQVDSDLGPVLVKPSRLELWSDIYAKKEVEKIDALFIAAEKALQEDETALARLSLIRENLWQPALKQAEEYKRETDAKAHWWGTANSLDSNEKIILDGMLNEKAWQQQTPLYLLETKGGAVPHHTKVRLLRDPEYLYIGFECDEPNTAEMIAAQREFDDLETWRDNCIEIFLDAEGKGRKYCQIIINSLACVADQLVGLPGSPGDWTWNSGAIAKQSVKNNQAWQMEVAIPLKNLVPLNPEGFSANFTRSRVISNVEPQYYKSSPYATGFHDVENFTRILLQEPENRNLLINGDFTGRQSGRFIPPWAANERINLDRQVFLVGGGSLRLDKDSTWVSCSLKDLLKPDTEYALSFYIKLQDLPSEGGLGLRFHDGAASRGWKDFPPTLYHGSTGWIRQEMRLRSEKDAGEGQHPPSLAFTLRKAGNGKAWVDKVSLVEIHD